MRKKLIAAIIVVCIFLATAIALLVYLENPGREEDPTQTNPGASAGVQSTHEDSQAPTETEETVGISLPTEGTENLAPEFTWSEDNSIPPETAAPVDPDATFDPDENETPEMAV